MTILGNNQADMVSRDKSKILLVAAGGEDDDRGLQRPLNSVEILDPTSGEGWVEGMTIDNVFITLFIDYSVLLKIFYL